MDTRQRNLIKSTMLFLLICGLAMGVTVANAASRPIYNEHADARQDVAAALAKAEKTGRNVVLIFGANW